MAVYLIDCNTSPPVVFDRESIAEHGKKCKELHEEYASACYLIDYDLDRYKRAFRLAVEGELNTGYLGFPLDDKIDAQMREYFAQADRDVPLSARDREAMEIQRAREEEAKQKAEARSKKDGGTTGEVEGQLKIPGVKDDGSEAEAASECTTRAMTDEEKAELDADFAEAEMLSE